MADDDYCGEVLRSERLDDRGICHYGASL